MCRITPANAGVCDLFAGSGCVSYRLSSRFPVVSCDIQYYSKVICDALLLKPQLTKEDVASFLAKIEKSFSNSLLPKSFEPLITLEEKAIQVKNLEILASIIENGSIEVFRMNHKDSILTTYQEHVIRNLANAGISMQKSLLGRYYGGVYFSYKQAVVLDIILSTIQDSLLDNNKSIFLAALLSTASDIVDTVGKHFAQPIKVRDSKGSIKTLVYNKAIKDKTIDALELYKTWLWKYFSLPRNNLKHQSMQGDYLSCLSNLSEDIRTVYADPPYTRDHYSRFYHVLETIALGDTPKISTIVKNGQIIISNGLYRVDRHQSPFCIKSLAPNAFDELFHAVATSNRSLILSYSPYDETKKTHPRVVTMNQLLTWAKEHFYHVEVISAGHFTHNKLNSKIHHLHSSDEAEVLIVCSN